MKRQLPFHSNAVWPPFLLIGMFVGTYCILDMGLWFLRLRFSNLPEDAFDSQIYQFRTAVLTGAAIVYALFRLWRFHPIFNPRYSAWLKSSPWMPNKPLPLGPVHPVGQDVVVLGILGTIAHYHAHEDFLLPAAMCGFTYLVAFTFILMSTRQRKHCFLLGLLWPSLALPALNDWQRALLLLPIIIVIWHGYRCSLRAFPWNPWASQGGRESLLQKQIRIDVGPYRQQVGWPFYILSPKLDCASISVLTSLGWSMLMGWWSFCIIKAFNVEPSPEWLLIFAFFAAVLRFAVYCGSVSSPFNAVGRITSGRIVIPAFDKIFVAPLLTILLGIVCGMIVRRSGSWYPFVESVAFGALWFVLLATGPKLKTWLLTGYHRYNSPKRISAQKYTLKPL